MLKKDSRENLKGFTVRFDRLDDFLATQGIYLDVPRLNELSHRYTGNNLELRSTPILLSFSELEQLIDQALQMQ